MSGSLFPLAGVACILRMTCLCAGLAEVDVSRSDSTARGIAEDIGHYLARHPYAADTASGIQRCWLPAKWADAPINRVEEALEILEEAGVVIKRHIPGGSVVYAARMR